jgi:hydrogenase/urease accessory protein HupE
LRTGVVFSLFLFFSLGLRSHELRPGYLEIREQTSDTYQILWKVPAKGGKRFALIPRLPEACSSERPLTTSRSEVAFIDRWSVACPGGLSGNDIRIDGLARSLTDVLVRVEHAGGHTQVQRLTPNQPSFRVQSGPVPFQGVKTYLTLGIKHIVVGIDHLLFVLGLLLIVGNRLTLIKTITAFTLAHSLTLGIATLGYAQAPVLPLNATIALSILFLGPEIVRVRRGETSFTIRHPWVVAFAFGLLHGFGFASGLTTLGLVRGEIPAALFLFNVGVELGQLFFVLIIVLLERAFRILLIRWPRWVEAMPAYAIGGLGAFWTIQRVAVMVGGVK